MQSRTRANPTDTHRKRDIVKLSPMQEAHLKSFEDKYTVYKLAELQLEASLRESLERELLSLRIDASMEGNRAVALDVPITRLGDKGRRGMNTRNFNTIKAFLALTEGHQLETAATALETVERFTLLPATEERRRPQVRVRMAGEDWEAFKKENAHKARGTHAHDDSADYYIFESGALSNKAIGFDDATTANKFDSFVTGWLQHSDEGSSQLRAFLARASA